MFPKNLIFWAPSFLKYLFDSKLDDKQSLNLLNNDFEKFGKISHLCNVFFVILPFKSIIGIFLLYKLLTVFGHISESIKKTLDGLQ